MTEPVAEAPWLTSEKPSEPEPDLRCTTLTTPVGLGAEAGPYRALGWTVGIFGDKVWTLTGMALEALDMPWLLAANTLTLLRASGHDAPVIAIPGPARRALVLTRPHHNALLEFRRDTLPALDVEHLWAGTRVDLPPTPTRWGPLWWVTPAVTPLPPFPATAAALLAAAAAFAGGEG